MVPCSASSSLDQTVRARLRISASAGSVLYAARGSAWRCKTSDARRLTDPPRRLTTGGKALHIFGRHRLACDAPVAAAHFFDQHPRHGTHFFTLDRDHGVGKRLDDLLLLRRREHALDELDLNQWHDRLHLLAANLGRLRYARPPIGSTGHW